MTRLLLLLVSGLLLCASCSSSKPLYGWYGYESAAYRYSKRATPEMEKRLLLEYRKMVSRPKGVRKAVPPGLYAEFGFLLCQTGHRTEGLAFLREEVKAYPESEKYISRIIKQLEQ